MMNYSRPVISIDSGLAEGVYMASGCLNATVTVASTDIRGEANQREFHVEFKHDASHTNNAQTVVIQLNTAVTVINGNGQNFLKSGGGSNTLTFTRSNFMNGQDNGSFNFVVQPVDASFKADGLTATVVSVYDDYSA